MNFIWSIRLLNQRKAQLLHCVQIQLVGSIIFHDFKVFIFFIFDDKLPFNDVLLTDGGNSLGVRFIKCGFFGCLFFQLNFLTIFYPKKIKKIIFTCTFTLPIGWFVIASKIKITIFFDEVGLLFTFDCW